ncbi:MAG: ABC-2 family transporter protein [Planctomycetes bacterium]|nr:ABC-2 family transporter protein [Planctomycetota bacterium]
MPDGIAPSRRRKPLNVRPGRVDCGMRTARLAWLLFVTVLKRRLAYRGDLILQGLDEIMRGLVAFAMLQVYVSKSPQIADWGKAELTFILGFSMVPIALFHCFCSNLYQLSNTYIIQGNLDRVLLRPYPAFLQICFDRLAIEDLSGVVFGFLVMAIAVPALPDFHFDAWRLALLVVLMASAFVLVLAVFMAFAASGFWFEDRVGMVPPVYNLMELGRWPNSIYPPALKFLISCVVPFSFVAFYPASVFTGNHLAEPVLALATPLVATVALLVALCMWRAGIRRYNSTGT